jgi:methylmalonyl-CoA mutase N-terminal domain/subunit
VANVADPLGGSWFVEELTNDMEREAEVIFALIGKMGEGSMLEGCVRGIEENWFQGRIADSAYELERSFNSGERVIVGVSDFLEGNDDTDLATLRITNEDERKQRARLQQVRLERDTVKVQEALHRLRLEAGDPSVNLMPALIDAAKAYATVGEMMSALADVFGRYVEVPSL